MDFWIGQKQKIIEDKGDEYAGENCSMSASAVHKYSYMYGECGDDDPQEMTCLPAEKIISPMDGVANTSSSQAAVIEDGGRMLPDMIIRLTNIASQSFLVFLSTNPLNQVSQIQNSSFYTFNLPRQQMSLRR